MQGERATIKTRDALVCSFCPTLRRFLCRCFSRLLNSKQGRLNSAGQGKGYSAQERVEVEDTDAVIIVYRSLLLLPTRSKACE